MSALAGGSPDSCGAYLPLTNTNCNGPGSALTLSLSRGETGSGWKGNFEIGATFVYRHSSFFVVGNPSAVKRSNALRRMAASHSGSLPNRISPKLARLAVY